jgi:hypothetical protein
MPIPQFQPLKKYFLFLLLFIFSICPIVKANENLPLCRNCFDTKREGMLDKLDSLEQFYNRYRWIQSKLRRIYYDPLWKARTKRIDPLSKSTREAGQIEEDYWMKELKELEAASSDVSNGFVDQIHEMQNAELVFLTCCPEKKYKECVQEYIKPITKVLDQVEVTFAHIFEHEREYLKEVSLTAGPKEGLYMEDALEPKKDHTDYYARFESFRESRRFEEDQTLLRYFHQVRKMLNDSRLQPDCCVSCLNHRP